MGDKVNLVLQGRSTNVDKQKATAAMQEFFTKNKVSGFNVNHQGKRDESSFVIGTLATTNGNFRVNCFLKKVQKMCIRDRVNISRLKWSGWKWVANTYSLPGLCRKIGRASCRERV